MSRLFLIIFLTALFSLNGSSQTDEQKKVEIDDFMSRADKTFETSKKVFTVTETRKNKKFAVEDLNYKIQKGERLTRKFSYSANGKEIERLAVHYKTGKFSAVENYYFKNKQLIYASEQHFYEFGGETNSVWSGVFYFSNGKIIAMSTNGHGKSETDEWEPEREVLLMSRTRLSQLNTYLAQKN